MKKLNFFNIFSYGLAEFGSQFSWSLISSYLMLYYSDIVGFSPVIISGIMLIARVIDAFDDPFIGMITERTKSKFGRFRPYLLISAPFLALFNVLTFTSFDIPLKAKIIASCVSYVSCGIFYSIITIALGSLGAVMSPTRKDRVLLNVSKQVGGSSASLIISALTMPLLLFFGNGKSNEKAFILVASLYSLITFITVIISFFGTKEQLTLTNSQPTVTFRKGLGIALKDRNILTLGIAMILFLSGIFGRLSTMLYYYIYVLENVNIVAPISSILSISLILPVLFVPTLIKKFDIKNVMTASALLCSFGCLLIWIFGRTNTLVLVIATIILGAGNWISLCSGPLVAEIIDAIQIKHLIRIEGTVYSCISFTTKLGNTIGATVGILLLAAVGYTANEVQSESVKEGMNIIVNLVPAILFLASALFFYFITLTNKKGDENTKIIKEIFGLQGGNDEEK